MDATVGIAVLALLVFGLMLVTLHFWGKQDKARQDVVVSEDIVRVLTGPVPVPVVRARLSGPNSPPPSEAENGTTAQS